MAAKKTAAKKQTISQPELIAALKDAGYELDGFKRKGDNLIIRLFPHDLSDKPSGYPAACDVTDAADLPARCTVFADGPRNLLILTVNLPECTSGSPGAPDGEEPETLNSNLQAEDAARGDA